MSLFLCAFVFYALIVTVIVIIVETVSLSLATPSNNSRRHLILAPCCSTHPTNPKTMYSQYCFRSITAIAIRPIEIHPATVIMPYLLDDGIYIMIMVMMTSIIQ